jgi:hypothetical protein
VVMIDEKANHLFKDDQNYRLRLMCVHTADIFIIKTFAKNEDTFESELITSYIASRCSGMPNIVCVVYFTFYVYLISFVDCGHPPL